MKVLLIGAGGIGAWVAQALGRTLDVNNDTLVIQDADTIETRNLDRQLFGPRDIGKNKAVALRKKLQIQTEVRTVYFDHGADCGDVSVIITAVDNHTARAVSLAQADINNIPCITAANEYDSAEAYIYLPEWRGNPSRDPRLYYPEILTDRSDDPLSPPCTGEIQQVHPQLAIANMSAATYAMWLFWLWVRSDTIDKISLEVRDSVPFRINSTVLKVWSHKGMEDTYAS